MRKCICIKEKYPGLFFEKGKIYLYKLSLYEDRSGEKHYHIYYEDHPKWIGEYRIDEFFNYFEDIQNITDRDSKIEFLLKSKKKWYNIF